MIVRLKEVGAVIVALMMDHNFNSMIVRLKVAVKAPLFVRSGCGFQFYDSPIKRCSSRMRAIRLQTYFNSMIVRLKAGGTYQTAHAGQDFNSMIVRLKV